MPAALPARLARPAALLAALLGPAAAGAHELWLAREGAAVVLRAGHPGAPQPIDAARVTAIRCLPGPGPGPAVDARARAAFAPAEVRIPGPCAVVTVALRPAFWSLTPDGQVERPRDEVPDAVRSWEAIQLAKWIDPGAPAAGAALAEPLELVPVTDLSRARKGDKVAVRVLAGGAPAPGAAVALGHHGLGLTDSKGELRLRLRATGTTVVSASLRRPLASPRAESQVLEASLSFEVAP
ncbi:DUF4198 domain-containing protein [Anaeromyxobacter sp. Red801]|uniref:DUF4198 domain-containing protein n=1 Tax=Anaeromyxobacter sp. Red801 TaxID=3411632 RepID=UPI003BA1A46A